MPIAFIVCVKVDSPMAERKFYRDSEYRTADDPNAWQRARLRMFDLCKRQDRQQFAWIEVVYSEPFSLSRHTEVPKPADAL